MSSYRPYPPQSSFAPPPPPPPPSQPPVQQGNQYNQNWGYSDGGGSSGDNMPMPPPSSYSQMPPNSSYHHPGYGSSSSSSHHYGHSRNQHPQPPPPPHQQYSYLPPPPPPESSYPPPPPPPAQESMPLQPPQQPPMYYQSSQYNQYNPPPMQPAPPPPPPSSPPPSSSIPPPPPPGSPPPSSSSALPHGKESGSDRRIHERGRGMYKERGQGSSIKQQKPAAPPVAGKKTDGPSGRLETEEERRLRKKKELEKQRQEEKHRQQLKESQNTVLQKTQMLSAGKGHGSVMGSRMGDKRTAPLLSGDRVENRLKKPTTFLCKLKFRNELPDPTAQPKLLTMKRDPERFTRYHITSMEKNWKPQLHIEPDLGIPLDLLDLSVYNPPKDRYRAPLAPEDEELLRDDDVVTPVKSSGIKRKERPTDKGVSWLVKTQYISSFSTDSTRQSLTEKQAKELREMKGARNVLEDLNNRERQIKQIEASFETVKKPPVHSSNKKLYPVEVLPLVPHFERHGDQFVMVQFDSSPTADTEIYGKFDQSARDSYESKGLLKSYKVEGSDPAKPEKFLGYMLPSPGELSKDIYDEHEDVPYSWLREYHWDVRGDDADDPTMYLVSFGETEARYMPLPTKLNLRKRRAIEGRSSDGHFLAPSRVTVRQRPTVAIIEGDPGVYSKSNGSASTSKMRGFNGDVSHGRTREILQHHDGAQYSEAEDDMSE